jgi:hypothetical protein
MSDAFDSRPEACQVCGKAKTDSQELCNCGYHFERKETRDWSAARRYLAELKAKDWRKEVQVLRVIYNVQRKKNGRWSQRNYGRHLGRSLAQISDDLKLADALEKYPLLHKCKNKTNALSMLKSIRTRKPGALTADKEEDQPFKEVELRNFLTRNWDHTPLAANWELVRPEYPTSVGEIDLFAKHKTDRKYLVIELKVVKTSDDVIGQILRYMGWVKLNLARGENEKVEGLIIAPGIDEKTFCSLVDLNDISVSLYRLKDNSVQLDGIDGTDLMGLIGGILNDAALKCYAESWTNSQKLDPRLSQIIKACS